MSGLQIKEAAVEIYVVLLDAKTIESMPRFLLSPGLPTSSRYVLQLEDMQSFKLQVFFQKLKRKIEKAGKESSASHVHFGPSKKNCPASYKFGHSDIILQLTRTIKERKPIGYYVTNVSSWYHRSLLLLLETEKS
jgi:hypothetical protein